MIRVLVVLPGVFQEPDQAANMMVELIGQPEIDRAQGCHIARIFIVEMAVGSLIKPLIISQPRQIGGKKRMNRRLGVRGRHTRRRRNLIRKVHPVIGFRGDEWVVRPDVGQVSKPILVSPDGKLPQACIRQKRSVAVLGTVECGIVGARPGCRVKYLR